MGTNRRAADKFYQLVANDEDARVCTDISDDACREVPGNFVRMLSSQVLTSIGDLLINPKTVLAWLIGAVGAPASLVAWLVPIRESGSLIPQLAIGAWVRRHPQRKSFWVLGSVLQGLAVAGMAACVWLLDGLAAGLGIIGLLILFSLARGLCSVAMKDVQGKCIPKSRRGRLSGLAATLSGLITLALAAVVFHDNAEPGPGFYTVVLLAAAATWLLAAAQFARVEEFDGETSGGGNAFKAALASLSLLRDDAPFRHFVISRALLMASALASPFMVVLAQQQGGGALALGSFVMAASLASAISATLWGYMADTASRRVMVLGGALASLACLLTGGLAVIDSTLVAGLWFYPAAFFVLAVAHAGVRIGRKTYMVDMAGGNKRTDYVAVSNTAIGVLLLAAGGLSALASLISTAAVLIMLGMMGLAGAISAFRLKDVSA
ncbi:MFS transporter [Alcanivorax sp. JB21]|uniref:MFS transporter n=1 Tax=Alcanivorax limicola TaxID=2874102 RepID=UPI001CBF9741|nr:MFS transporter [Alcanivorax limicola]MBZ2189125.1 MFS transporter [Alcanivorax limicola]